MFGLLLLGLASRAAAESQMAYHGPPPIKEVFNFNERSYFLYSERVSWDEAFAICKSNDASLAAPDDSHKAAFLAQCIAEAWAPFEDMWIGGQKSEVKGWQWASLNPPKNIPERTRQDINMTFRYPPWIDGIVPERFNRDCLAIDRNGHSDPFFVDLECKMPRPFICEQTMKGKQDEPEISKKVEIYDAEFILFHGRLSWEGAVAFCRTNGYTLASIKNMTIAHKLAAAMLKTRPEFEDVWIGGQYKGDKWVWVADSEEMAVSENFPPWAHPPKKGKNCVLFDRHLCDEPKFLDVKCNRVRDFVCMRRAEEEVVEAPPPSKLRRKQRLYTIHAGQLSWDEAKVICEDTEGGSMLELEDPEEVSFLMQAMADNKQEIDHVWLAGKLEGDDWMWVYNETVIPPANEDGYPPWCDNEKIPEMNCLNMDRQNHITPLLYGLECNVTQGVICVEEAVDKGKRVRVGDVVAEVSLINQTEYNASWNTVDKLCKEDVGYLLHSVDDATLGQIAADLVDGRYMIGARIGSDGKAQWWNVPAGTEFKLSGLPQYEAGRECLVIKVENKAVKGLEGISCVDVNHDINFICRSTCPKQYDETDQDKKNWRCDWLMGEGVDERTIGKRCWRMCPKDQVVLGSRKIMCDMVGWRGAHDSIGEPQCVDASKAIMTLVKPHVEKAAGAVFIIDNTDRIAEDDFNMQRYLVGVLISLFKLDQTDPTKRLQFLAVVMNDSGTVVHSLDGEKPCDFATSFMRQVKLEGPTGGRRDFSQAFYEANHWLMARDDMVVFAIIGGPNQGESYRTTLRAMKRNCKAVFSIGFNHYTDEEMSDIATVADGQVNMLGYKNIDQLKISVESTYEAGTCDKEVNELKKDAEAVFSPKEAGTGPGYFVQSQSQSQVIAVPGAEGGEATP